MGRQDGVGRGIVDALHACLVGGQADVEVVGETEEVGGTEALGQPATQEVAMAKNLTLEWKADRFMRSARKLSRETEGTEHGYGECRYRAKTWKHERRVIIKAEVVRHPGREPKENPRFVVTNLPGTPQWIYEHVYCGRGEIENRIKELHHGLEIDRTSCARAQIWTLRDRLLKIGAQVVVSVRRVVVHLPSSCPDRDTWSRIAFSFGATAG